jgi:hypothetical protein
VPISPACASIPCDSLALCAAKELESIDGREMADSIKGSVPIRGAFTGLGESGVWSLRGFSGQMRMHSGIGGKYFERREICKEKEYIAFV